MMPEAVNLSGEQHGRIDQSAGNRADERDHLVVTEVIRHHELPVSVFDARGPKTAREAISDLVFKIVRLGHPEADPNRSGSEGQRPARRRACTRVSRKSSGRRGAGLDQAHGRATGAAPTRA